MSTLPPLPPVLALLARMHSDANVADDIRAYAAAAVAAERAALGAVLTYEDKGGPGASGQTIGADGKGWFSVLFYGAPDDAHRAAFDYVRERRKAGRRIVNDCIVTNEAGYCGPNVRVFNCAAAIRQEPA